jgi:cytosine/adenosine deaminase-related metal-dependent hydrolase
MRGRSLGTALVVSASSAMVLLSSGIAQAGSSPDVVGQKYSDAGSAISGAGMRAVVSTVVGDQKSWPDCLVTDQVARTVAAPENSSGSATNEVLVSLNCDAAAASAKSPGYSAASPEGKAIAAAAKAANSSG